MFAYFFLHSLEAASVDLAKASDKNALFDIDYISNNAQHISTTNGRGYFVAYYVYDHTGKQLDLKLVKSDTNSSTTDKVDVKFNAFKIMDYLIINFNITNNNYFARTIDLGVFGDIAFKVPGSKWNADNVYVKKFANGRGFWVDGGSQETVFQLENDGYFPPVDTLFIGEADNSTTSDPYKFHYFMNQSVMHTNNTDSVIAFSWKNKLIKGGETLRLGFMSKQNSESRSAGRLVDYTMKKEFYKKGENATIKFRMHDYDSSITKNKNYKQDNITIVANLTNNEKYTFVWETKGNETFKDFEIPLKNLNKSIQYSIYALGKKTSINSITGWITVRSKRPTFEVNYPPKSFYKDGSIISIQTEGQCVSYKSTFGNDGRIDTDNDKWYFIDFPEELEKGKTITLKLWCEAFDGVASEVKEYQITYGTREDNKKPRNNDKTDGTVPSGQNKSTSNDQPKKVNVLAIVLPIVFAVLIIAAAIVAVIIYNKKKNSSPKDDTEVPVTDGGAGKYQNFE